jgi:amidase
MTRFASAFFAAAGPPDVVATEGAFVNRHTLLSRWSEFQESHPLILAPIATDIPALAGTDLDEGQVEEDIRSMRMAMAVNALGLPAVACAIARSPR